MVLVNQIKEIFSKSTVEFYFVAERTDYIIQNWMRTTNSLLFLGTWEYLNNENFNSIEFDGI